MLKPYVFLFYIILFFSIPAISQDEWLDMKLGKVGDVSVHLKVKKYACAADTNWIGFEFVNEASDTIYIDKWISFSIERNANGWSGNLCSEANFYPFEKLAYNKYAIPPGKMSIYTPLSNEGSCMLGIPENRRDTFPVECSLRFNFPAIGDESIDIKNYEFTFFWYYPTDEQFNFLSQRLEKIIYTKEEERDPNEWYFHAMIINVPRITDSIPLNKYIQSLDSLYTWGFGGIRHKTIQYIDRKYHQDTSVQNYFRRALIDDYETMADDLSYLDSTSLILIDDLFEYYKRHIQDDTKRYRIINWLSTKMKYSSDAIVNEKRKAFFEAFISAFPIVKAEPDTLTLQELKSWAKLTQNLVSLGDPRTIEYLAPFLKNKTKTTEPYPCVNASYRSINVDCLRVCDYALESIYKIQGRQLELKARYGQYLKRGQNCFYEQKDLENFYKIIQYERDHLIRELRIQLKKEKRQAKRRARKY